MGWRSTIVLTLAVILIGGYLWFEDMPTTTPVRPGSIEAQPPHAEPAEAVHKLLDFQPTDVVELQLQRADQTRTVKRQGGNWQGADDPAVINDFLHSISTLGVLADIPASAKELADYGLDPPHGVIEVHLDKQAVPLILQIGDRNPPTTGVYVRFGNNGPVALAGALVEWEFDTVFKRLGRAG